MKALNITRCFQQLCATLKRSVALPSTSTSLRAPPRRSFASTTEPAGFFKLPRELRDQVYDSLYYDYESEEHRANHGRVTISITCVCKTLYPIRKARLISRQLKDEYEQRMPFERYYAQQRVPNMPSVYVVQCYVPAWPCGPPSWCAA